MGGGQRPHDLDDPKKLEAFTRCAKLRLLPAIPDALRTKKALKVSCHAMFVVFGVNHYSNCSFSYRTNKNAKWTTGELAWSSAAKQCSLNAPRSLRRKRPNVPNSPMTRLRNDVVLKKNLQQQQQQQQQQRRRRTNFELTDMGRQGKERMAADPQNSFWAKDVNKFGRKMLERMGWSEGQGLGADGTGTTTHVEVVRKTDNAGTPIHHMLYEAQKDFVVVVRCWCRRVTQ
jgi:hypothetical protein